MSDPDHPLAAPEGGHMKKTIFLSHISEEGALGTLFKDRLEKDFLSLIDVFVSSDARSIPPGDAWLKAVDDNLNRAAALIVLPVRSRWRGRGLRSRRAQVGRSGSRR